MKINLALTYVKGFENLDKIPILPMYALFLRTQFNRQWAKKAVM